MESDVLSAAAMRLLEEFAAARELPARSPDAFEARRGWEAAVAEANAGLDADIHEARFGSVEGEWVTAGPTGAGVLLLVHGGGFGAGSPATHRQLAAALATATERAVAVPDYRLAPEHPFPAGPNDVRTAYAGLIEAGHRSDDVVLVGDSAGGALVAGLLHRLRDQGAAQPAAAVLLSPWLDLALTGASTTDGRVDDPVTDRIVLDSAAADYLAGADPRDQLASPLFGDPTGLPPLLIQVGSRELLLDDAVRYADLSRAAGVEVELQIWSGLWHVFQLTAELPETAAAIAEIARFIGSRTGATGLRSR